MESRLSIDPELHMLRSAARMCDGRTRQEIESARFNVFAAFQHCDAEGARRWLAALMLSVASATELDIVREEVRTAMARIAQAIEDEMEG